MGLEGGNDMYVTENIYSCDICGFEGVGDITDDVTDSTTASVIYKCWCRSNEIFFVSMPLIWDIVKLPHA